MSSGIQCLKFNIVPKEKNCLTNVSGVEQDMKPYINIPLFSESPNYISCCCGYFTNMMLSHSILSTANATTLAD